MIDLRSEQMIQHVHGGREQDALVGLTGLPGEDAGEEGLSNTGVTDQDDIGALRQERKIQQAKDAVLRLHTALVMVEVESVNARL